MGNLLNAAWGVLRDGNKNGAQVALAISAIGIACTAGLVLAFLYGISARSEGSCGLGCQLSGGWVAMLAAAGAFSAGGLLGLLFGAPRWTDAPPTNAHVDAVKRPDTDATPTGPPVAPALSASNTASRVRPNTSLEKIADWLTTIIVGLGLVHLKDLEGRISESGVWLSNAITLNTAGRNGTVGVVLALTFSVAGFVLVYLWSLRFLPSEIEGAYSAIKALSERTEDLAKKVVSETASLRNRFKNQPLYAVPEQALHEMQNQWLALGLDGQTASELEQRYAAARTWSDEPLAGFGPAQADGFALSAAITELLPGSWHFVATISVQQGAAVDKVVWLLHHSFGPPVWAEGLLGNGRFVYQNQTAGAFCLGALVLRAGQPALRLALDLRNAPGATETFKAA
jgi:hypothetical protein